MRSNPATTSVQSIIFSRDGRKKKKRKILRRLFKQWYLLFAAISVHIFAAALSFQSIPAEKTKQQAKASKQK